MEFLTNPDETVRHYEREHVSIIGDHDMVAYLLKFSTNIINIYDLW